MSVSFSLVCSEEQIDLDDNKTRGLAKIHLKSNYDFFTREVSGNSKLVFVTIPEIIDGY